jgi:hypothetical protein
MRGEVLEHATTFRNAGHNNIAAQLERIAAGRPTEENRG